MVVRDPRWAAIVAQQVTCKRSFSGAALRSLQLAYDLHEPTKDRIPEKTKPAIVFIHGLFGSKKNNRSMSKILARDLQRPVYAIDCRNHGDSPHDPRHDYSALATDVEEFLAHHRLADVTLIGHSMGAKTAMTVALQQPESIGSLISIDNAPVDAALKSDFGKYVQGMKAVEDAKVLKQSDADEILKPYEESLAIRQFLLTNLVRATDGPTPYQKFRIPLKTLALALDNMADFPYKDPEEVQYRGPALFVRGTRSRYVADETLPVIGSFFPRFELVDIEAGHWVVSENPMAFRDAVVEFLEDKT
ncbi:MAG: hypothetical protein M1828_000390 [Chrysothrix sp. TS-e1954]|nr:MAG: hypothetical protein M1828_000390 [Chrysothrix sp. TS-e1954]